MQEKYIIFLFFLIVFPRFCEHFNPRFTCTPLEPSSATDIGRFPFSPKFRKFWLEIKWNAGYFGSVRPEYLGPPLKVVHFDRSGHFGRSDRNVRFHLTQLLSLVPLLHSAYGNNNQTRGGLRRVCATGIYCSIGHVELWKLKLEFLLNWNAHS